MLKRLVFLIPLIASILAWELLAYLEIWNPTLFPPPLEAGKALVEMYRSGELWLDITSSASRAAIGYFVGCILGIVVGVVTGRVNWINKILGPLINVLRAFPPVALVPFAITWFGLGEFGKYFLVIWGVFFPVWVNTHVGVSAVDEDMIRVADCLNVVGWRRVMELIVPSAIGHVLAGMQIAIGICFMCVFVAEMAGAYEGLGFRINTSYLIFRVDKMVAALCMLGLMGAVSDFGFRMITRWLFPWTFKN